MKLFVLFALAIFNFSIANAEDYDYDGLVSEEPIQVISYEIDPVPLLICT